MGDNRINCKGVCRYGTDCFRLNPAHLKEFSHPHLEKIIRTAVNDNYDIPDDIFVSSEILLKQLEIVKTIIGTSYTPTSAQSTKNEHSTTTPESATKNRESPGNNIKPVLASTKTPVKASKLNPSATPFHPVQKKIKLDDVQSFFATNTPQTNTSTTISSHPKPSTSQHANAPSGQQHKIEDYIQVVAPRGQMAKKLEKSKPYNFFMTTITSSSATHHNPLFVTFQELLDDSLGEIESSVQINFMIDVGWLLAHYYFSGNAKKPLLILYGDETPELLLISTKRPNVQAVKVEKSSAFGIHHTKMMIFFYTDKSVRIVVSTANLYEDDWHNRTQGLWISPRCPQLPDGSDTDAGDSATGFKFSLLNYLSTYKIVKLLPYITQLRQCDFREVNVFLISSVPGGHRTTPKGPPWGHPRLGYVLEKHAAPIEDSWPIVCQSSSIGSLGKDANAWIREELFCSFRRDTKVGGLRSIPEFKMIYPSFSNVIQSHDSILGGGCLPYSKNVNDKQPWLKKFLYQWKSKSRHCNQAMPHIKTYFRWNQDKLAWFCLTSANLSKAAWGMYNKTGLTERPLRISNYECGVLFLPRFVIGKELFTLNEFPMPYDIPLTKYGIDDVPFLADLLH